jgi:nicotinamide-nucleotide amidase
MTIAPLQTAEIIAVGSELLATDRSDTNSLYLTGRLNELGIAVIAKAIIGDDAVRLSAAVSQSLMRVDLLVITGGLGPTDDDVTREAVAAALGRSLEHDETVMADVAARFAVRKLPMPAINRRQAQVIRGATVLTNPNGSAPGQWIEHDGKVVVLLPGPPRELQPMVERAVLPRLAGLTAGRRLRRRVVKIAGRPESTVDEIAQPIYGPWRTAAIPIETTILAAPGQIELHLVSSGADLEAIDAALDRSVRALADAFGAAVFAIEDLSLEEVLGRALRDRKLRIAVAESCTGGLALGRLTNVPGSSAWVIGGVVAYANEVKVRDLDVPPELIDAHGAVSEPVARAMAEGVRRRLGADIGLSITGIAGPDGGTAEKPVGTVVIAAAGLTPDTQVKTWRFTGDRHLVRRLSTSAALDLVRRLLR